MTFKTVAAAALLIASAPFAQASLATYGDQTLWQSKLVTGSAQTDQLETFSNGDSPSPNPLNLKFGSSSVTGALSGTNSMTFYDNSAPDDYAGRKSHSGSMFWEGGPSFSIEFSEAVSAFGFWGSDIGDFSTDCPTGQTCSFRGSVLTLKLYYDDGKTSSVDVTGAGGGAEEFFGLVETGTAKIQKVEFINNTGTIDGQGFDDFTIGEVADVPPNPTPEPASLALMGLALAGLAASRRRSSR